MVKDACTNIQSKIKINGLLSDPFTLTQEVCQGCLFSMLLYIIAAEVLASFINANKRIKGIQYLELRGKKIIVNQKIRLPRYLAQMSIWMIGLGILDIETQLNSLKIKWIQRLLNPTNALWKNLMLYQLNLILNYNQGPALFR